MTGDSDQCSKRCSLSEIKILAIRGVRYYGKYLHDKSVVRPLSVLDLRCSFPYSSSFSSLPALGAYLPRGRLTYLIALLRFPTGRLIGEDLKVSGSPRQFHFRDGDSALGLQRLRGVLDRAKRLHVGRELAVAVDVPIELAFVENHF